MNDTLPDFGGADLPLVLVEWVDTYSSDRWENYETLVKENDDRIVIYTVGWEIARSKDRITVVATIQPSIKDRKPVTGCLQMTIPMPCVVSVVNLSERTKIMPKGKSPGPSVKAPKVYEALKNQRGMSKQQAAKISNAQASKSGSKGKR